MFENPPPRPTFVATPVARPVAATRDTADIEALRDARQLPGTPRSDSQNVHDSSVVKSVKMALDRLGPSSIPLEKTAVEVRAFLKDDEDALKGLDLTETNTVAMTSLKMTESEVLRRVWGRIREEPSEPRRNDMKEMLRKRLAESGKKASCASGRVARIVDALSTFDYAVRLRPVWALRQEMMAKAASIRNRKQDNDTRSLSTVLRDVFKRDYVDSGLTTMNVVNAELASWGDDLELFLSFNATGGGRPRSNVWPPRVERVCRTCSRAQTHGAVVPEVGGGLHAPGDIQRKGRRGRPEAHAVRHGIYDECIASDRNIALHV